MLRDGGHFCHNLCANPDPAVARGRILFECCERELIWKVDSPAADPPGRMSIFGPEARF